MPKWTEKEIVHDKIRRGEWYPDRFVYDREDDYDIDDMLDYNYGYPSNPGEKM